MNLHPFSKCTIVFLLLTVFKGFGQAYDFKVYDTNLGLPQNFVYCLAQGKDGYLWMGTGEGLVKYDGLKFQGYTVNDSLSSDFSRDLFVDSKGILWIGHENGGITCQIEGEFVKIVAKETSSPIRDICETPGNQLWAVEQNHGIVKIDPQKLSIQPFFDRKLFGNRRLFYSIFAISDEVFLVGTNEGLTVVTISGESVVDVKDVESIPAVNITAITKRKMAEGEFWIATGEKGFYLYKHHSNTSEILANNNLCLMFNIENENITDIVEEDEGNLLMATWGNGVIKLIYDPISATFKESMNFSISNGLNNNYIQDILCDREGNYWFATYGGGVSALINDYFIFYQLEEIGFKNNRVNSVIHLSNDLWMGLDNGILKTDPFCFANHEFYDQLQGIPNDNITGFYQDNKGDLWVTTREQGLYIRKKGQQRFIRFHFTNSLLGNQINDIDGFQDRLYLATMGGLYVLDRSNGKIIQLTTEKSLPHNNINFVYKDQKNQIWVGPKSSGICKIDIDNLSVEVHRLDQTPVDVADLTEDMDGNLWLATKGKGVLKYTEDTVEVISIQHGLSKNYCYNITCDADNRLWICHHPGLSCIDLKSSEIRVFGHESSLGGDFHQVWKDINNTLWFASSEGVIQYFPERDKANSIPPLLNFLNIDINGKKYKYGEEIRLPYLYRRNYKFKFDFIGISFKNPQGVTYRYRMEKEGEEDISEWIDLGTANSREYEFLPDGNYTFNVIAYNADGSSNPNPLTVKFSIAPPIWKKAWFYLVVVALFAYLIYLLIRYRERQLIQQKIILQNEVASQTVMLRNQKAEIERKNRDITDSINYAKRIQASILPPITQLRSVFPESFVYFLPRDIVSGDFYWFHYSKDKFTISVADCTGHGVPGAFMSMIGSTLLNDIIKSYTVNSPADILESLDREIKILLQKNSVDQTQDGMDISIVEVHIPSRKVRMASAKRPVILFVNDEMTVYKGSRRSIGESISESDSNFVNVEYQLSKNDSIYLFSDGYTDQFGGPLGKKFMKVGVQNLLNEVKDLPMAEQLERIKHNFSEWKGELDQVDDVIFVGFKIS